MPPRKRAAKTPQPKKYEQEFSTLTYEELRRELQEIGEDPGPIDASNKEIYVRMLARKRMKLDTETTEEQQATRTGTTTSSIALVASVTKASVSLTRTPLKSTLSLSAPMPKPSAVVSPPRKTATPKVAVISPPRKTATPRTPLKYSSRMATQASSVAKFEVKGLLAAPYTPFTDTGELNLSMIKKYADHLCATGVINVFVNGSTGESLSLTAEERKLTAEEWIKASAGRITVIVHVGCESLKDTCELAQHAQKIGASAIGMMPTTFFKPASIEHLTLYLEKVAEAVPNIPLFYYHIPAMTGVAFSMEEFLDVAFTRLPTLRGLKFTSPDLFEYGRCVVNHGGKYQILYGCDQQLLGALAMGCTAAVGSTYNYAGKLNNRMLSAFERKDINAAQLEQMRSQAMIRVYFKYGGHAGTGKAIMKLQGLDLGPPRLPVLPLSPETVKSLESDLKDIGFFEWA